MEPHELRLLNLVQPAEMPYDNITKKHFDSGDYPEAVRRAARLIDVKAFRERQKKNSDPTRRLGLGFGKVGDVGSRGEEADVAGIAEGVFVQG